MYLGKQLLKAYGLFNLLSANRFHGVIIRSVSLDQIQEYVSEQLDVII